MSDHVVIGQSGIMPKWKELYQQYESLEARWPADYPTLLRDLLLYGDLDQIENKFRFRNAGLIQEAMALQPAFEQARLSETPKEDVFQAAMVITVYHRHWSLPDYYHRGQRRSQWADHVEPSIFRRGDTNTELSETELQKRLVLLRSYTELLDSAYQGEYTETQRIAIAQHYGVKTWLVDLTTDPWVALFFASHGGKQGDIGIVQRFSAVEWNRLSVAGENALGAMRLIEVPGVLRIEAQKALFLEASHPDLIDQYVAETLHFHQHDGLSFESPARGISPELLLSKEDPIAMLTDQWRKRWEAQLIVSPCAVDTESLRRANRRLSADDYFAIVLSWIEQRQKREPGWRCYPTGDTLETLRWVCAVHAAVQKQREMIPNYKRSIHLLRGATESILVGHNRDVILEDYENTVGKSELEIALRALEG